MFSLKVNTHADFQVTIWLSLHGYLKCRKLGLVTRFLHQFVVYLLTTFLPFLSNISEMRVSFCISVDIYSKLQNIAKIQF